MPNKYRKGTVTITLRVPSSLKQQMQEQARSQNVSLNQLIRDALEREAAAALRQRMLNPLRKSPRKKPRDPDSFLALAWSTRQHVQRDQMLRRLGPHRWELS